MAFKGVATDGGRVGPELTVEEEDIDSGGRFFKKERRSNVH
jgi:hypothetical protein